MEYSACECDADGSTGNTEGIPFLSVEIGDGIDVFGSVLPNMLVLEYFWI